MEVSTHQTPSDPIIGDLAKDEIIARYLPMVRSVAVRIHRRLPDEIDLESLIRSRVFNLIDAMTRVEEAMKRKNTDDIRETAESASNSHMEETNSESLYAADIMTRQVITMSPHHSFADAISLMAKHSFRHFLVVDTSGRLVGVVSDRDILRTMVRTNNWQATSVSQFMSHDVITVDSDTELSHVAGKMLSKRINCLPVVDDKNYIRGIITSTDLLKTYRSMQESVEKQAKSLKSPQKA
jgi:CBS-domain-containing membrane protein